MNRTFSALVALLILAATIFTIVPTNTSFAQGGDDPLKNFVFTSEATWLETPQFATVGSPINVRRVPSETFMGNAPIASLDPGSTVEIVAQYTDANARIWDLVRAWTPNQTYATHGWLLDVVAELNSTTATPLNVVPECTLEGKGVHVDVNIRFNDGWVHDALSTQCPLFYEGRREPIERHDYWVVRDAVPGGTGQTDFNDVYLTNGFMWLMEGGAWIHPLTWNVGDFVHVRCKPAGETVERDCPPMIQYFAGDKFAVMIENNYGWPIQVNLIDGSAIAFNFGSLEPNTVDRCDFDEPQPMYITGVFDSQSATFSSVSVGALNCDSLIIWQLPDMTWQLLVLKGSKERLSYNFVFRAYLMPSTATPAQIFQFATPLISQLQTEYALPAGTVIDVEGLDGTADIIIN